jgi:apolipoprotein N-acyltransferase
VLGLAALGGVWLVSAVLVAVNAAVAVALLPDLYADRLGATAVALALVAGAWIVGPRAVVAPADEDIAVAGVQIGVVHDPERRFDAGERATRTVNGADLVVWGESSVAYDLGVDAGHRNRLTSLAARVRAPLLVNTDARGPNGEVRKASVVVTADGLGDDYVKTRLVPFGEYVPLRPLFGWVTAVTDAARTDRGRGRGAHLIDVAGVRVGPLVCFESSFPDLARTLVRDGAEVIVVQSATTTFQDSWAPAQHASLAAVRAVESGRSVLHATLSGVSAAFDSTGRRLVWEPTDRTGTYTVEVPLATGETFFVRTGNWVPALSGIVALIGLALVGLRRR